MFHVHTKEIEWGGRKLVLETGRMARQADGAVLATYGETTVLCTAVAQRTVKPGVDFLPLTVNYQEKAFAAGANRETIRECELAGIPLDDFCDICLAAMQGIADDLGL